MPHQSTETIIKPTVYKFSYAATRFFKFCETTDVSVVLNLINTCDWICTAQHLFNSIFCLLGWGCCHEKQARQVYEAQMQAKHENFLASDSGFHVNPKWPFLGASPDGLVTCDCCEGGICEIKEAY